jgi:phospholipid/cholesterol/gamma-HCH transport system permease protein
MIDWLAGVGRVSRVTFEHAGGLGLLSWQIIQATVRLKVSMRAILNQMYIMGIQSLPIVLVTGSLAGIVTSQQGGYQMTSAMPGYILGSLVVETVVLEMGPVLTAIVLVGRIGARITAELGTMVVSEQIDAFKSLGRDPVAILAAPRVIAGILVLPLLVGILYSLTKALVFGMAIPLISVHMGLKTKGGAEGVGITTTQAVMFMTLTILILDALFPPLMLN